MARKQFLILYPDGSKKHVGRLERDSLLLLFDIKPTGSNTYAYTGQQRTFHTFPDLKHIRQSILSNPTQHFLDGALFLFQLKGKPTQLEREQTPEAMAYDLIVNRGLTV